MKNAWLIIFIIIVIVSSSCSISRDPNAERIAGRDYRRGTEGITLEFLDNNPPERVYAGSDMNILVEVKNEGAYPTTDSFDGKLVIYGYDEKAFSGERWDGSNFIMSSLQGRSQFAPQGSREIKKYRVDYVSVPFDQEFYNPTLIVAACYRYQTIANPMVCIDPEPYAVFDSQKVCTIPSYGKTYGLSSQGAPVAVTKVEEEVTGKNIIFNIYIKNVGRGRVVDIQAYNDCPLSLDYNNVDKVVVMPKLSYDATPICQPRGDYTDPVRLDQSGQGFITCRFRKPASASAIETPLNIQLDYRYLDWVEKKIQIINIDR